VGKYSLRHRAQKKTYGIARLCAVFGGALELSKNKQGRYDGFNRSGLGRTFEQRGLNRKELAVGLSENLVGASGAAGLASYFGTCGAKGGLNVALWNAFHGFEDENAQDALDLWLFEQKAKQEN